MLNRLRRAVRDRLVRVVDEVVTAHHRGYDAALTAHHRELDAALTAHHRELDAALTAGIDRVIRVMQDIEFRSRRDLWAAAEREAATSSERFVREVMPTGHAFDDSIATLKYALSLAPSDGMALEFGVYNGRTLKVIAEAREHNQVFGFDSFQG
ncbi:MAG: class I SAM-dependent methyltransferase, partial [Pseudonocardiaceae bacterium]